MPDEYEVRKVPKVVVQGIKPGEKVSRGPINQYWFVVEHIKSGERYGEHDEEAEAIAERDKRNAL